MSRWPNAEERFEAKVNRTATCWIWTAGTNGSGYGRFYVDGGMTYAHRYSYERSVGPIPSGLNLDHLCKTTLCVNPAHLEPVTQAENIRRGDWFIASNAAKTHCLYGHEYTESNTFRNRHGHRQCLTCRRKRDLKRQPAKRARQKARRNASAA